MGCSKGNLTRRHKFFLGLMLVLPLLVVLGKCSFMPTSEYLRAVSLADAPEWMHKRLLYVLTVPLGAILVVLCRLTLGIRILGPFRSILLALSFGITGIFMGIIFLIGVVATIAGVRPMLKRMRLPYFARVSIILSLVSIIIIATIVLGGALRIHDMRNVAFFPIFVLCLIGDAFSRILTKEGPRSALWRGTMTVLLGIVLTLLFTLPVVKDMLFNYPELLVTQVGLIVVIAEWFDLRLLHWMNPTVVVDEEEADDQPHPTDSKTAQKIELAA